MCGFASLRSIDQRLGCLRATVSIGFLCGVCLSWKLWISSRLFPLSPASDSLPLISFPLDYSCLFLLLGLLLGMAVNAQPRKFTLVSLILAGLLGLWDQLRWQPWVYQYLFMLAAIGFCAWRPGAKNRLAALNTCRLIVVMTYFWSGVQKLNANFVRETWPAIAGPWLQRLPILKNTPLWLILIIPLIEILTGLALLARKFRTAAVMLAVATHIGILTLLVYSGENLVVWPWNGAMIVFVVALFWNETDIGPREILFRKSFLHACVLLLFGVMPAFSFFSLWDSYLSSALYSGNTDQAVVIVSPAVINRLPAEIRPHIWQNTKPFFLDINRWAYGELNVPMYPEPRLYRRVAEQVCRYADDSPDIKLLIKQKPNPFTGSRKSQYYDCAHLDEL